MSLLTLTPGETSLARIVAVIRQLVQYLNQSTIPVANGGTGDSGTAWSTYTPTITTGAGTLTTVGASGRYKTLGKTMFLQIVITVTTNGTGATSIIATLPANAAAFRYEFPGINLTAGKAVTANINGGSTPTKATILLYDGTYPVISGDTLVLTGIYEAA